MYVRISRSKDAYTEMFDSLFSNDFCMVYGALSEEKTSSKNSLLKMERYEKMKVGYPIEFKIRKE